MASNGQPQPDKAWRNAVRATWLSHKLGRFNESYSSDGDDINGLMNTMADTDSDDDNEHFRRCWGRSSCQACLGISACSWCPFSATCVPNDYLVPALAPAWEGDLMCPYWAERWELRTRPLGCQVSTITSLTALVAGAVTLTVVLLVWAVVALVRWLRQRQQGQQRQPLSQLWSTTGTWLWRAPQEPAPPSPQLPPSEQSPLLSDIR